MGIVQTVKNFAEKFTVKDGSELTGAQNVSTTFSSSSSGGISGTDYEIYRHMRKDATIALARSVASAPLMSVDIKVSSLKDAPTEAEEFIYDAIKPVWHEFIRNLLYAVDYGWQSFEKVFKVENGTIVYDKLKPLLPDMTSIIFDKKAKSYAGLKQKDILIPAEKTFIYTYDGEGDNMYGRSRFENIRSNWLMKREVLKRYKKYLVKVAGITPKIGYPVGRSKDASGTERDNSELARQVLQNLDKGEGVAFPNNLSKWAATLLRDGANPAELSAWDIEYLSATVGSDTSFPRALNYLNAEFFRGFLVPERVATEGKYGTKAEAESHTDIFLLVSMIMLREIVSHVNRYMVNQLLELNFGPEAKNTVMVDTESLSTDVKKILSDIIKKLLGNKNVASQYLDIAAAMDTIGVPVSDSGYESEGILPDVETPSNGIENRSINWKDILENV